MPSCKLLNFPNNIHSVLWNIKETETSLLNQLPLNDLELSAYQKLSHPRRRLEWLAARLAMQALCKNLNHPYSGVTKNAFGKPFLINSSWNISLAHNFPLAFAAVSPTIPIGIDIQFIHPKLRTLAGKYLNFSEEQEQAINLDLEKLAIYWSAKEAIYKTYGNKRLSFKQDIIIKPFSKFQLGILHGFVAEHHFIVHYALISKHVLVWCQPQ